MMKTIYRASGITYVINTSLKKVYEALGDIPITLSYDECYPFGDEIHMETFGTEERKEKLKRVYEDNE